MRDSRITEYLNAEFEEYCTCDDYYQPVVEDFDIDSWVDEWSKINGFKVVSCEGNGDAVIRTQKMINTCEPPR